MGDQHLFEVQVYLNELAPQAVRVDLCRLASGSGSLYFSVV
ncbi:MAG: hypothetical protein ABIJ50_03300 [Pseudomonadota bacterium]